MRRLWITGTLYDDYARINWMMGPFYVGWRKTAIKLSLLWMETRLIYILDTGITYYLTLGKIFNIWLKTALWGFESTGVLGVFWEATVG